MRAEAEAIQDRDTRTGRPDMLGLILPVIVAFFFAMILSAITD